MVRIALQDYVAPISAFCIAILLARVSTYLVDGQQNNFKIENET